MIERSELLPTDDLDWDAVGTVELPAGAVQALVYMRDVEGFTPSYLLGLGAHRTTHADPLVSAFFDVWTTEEEAHSAAIHRYLVAYGAATGTAVPEPQPAPDRAPAWRERQLARVGGPVGSVVATAHMAWGAANELLTMNGYRLLADQSPDPVLSELLTRIAAQEARHYSFYLLQAEWRLAASPLARTVLRRVLHRAWTPVGVGDGYKTPEEFGQVLAYLIASSEAVRVIERMDNRFSALPGLADLRIFTTALRQPALART